MLADLTAVPPPPTGGFRMGTARAPDGTTLTLDSRSLRLAGRRWIPVMGEYHYARNPAAEWPRELAKMRAGGVDVVATYVFWIHHEEIENEWDWSGDRHLRRFVRAAAAAGLKVVVRAGPWCHGEVRHGGLPDWIVARGGARSDDPAYLAAVRRLYAQIAAQLTGLLWKNGGPVIGVQLENEYAGPAAHLLTLKRLARRAGLDVPLYTRTGWPALQTPLRFGELVPLHGAYAEGFWDRELTAVPGSYWAGFHFSPLRTDANIANEALGRRDVRDDPDVARYPYLTCEIGGGMMSSYHRRILADPRDAEALTLVRLGSGSNAPGYYMYHGGANPAGRRTPLMESQATAHTNWNDLPVLDYDFQAPLGSAGQVRPHYFLLRRLHRFLHAFGADLAGMGGYLPLRRPAGPHDTRTLRWAVRSDGRRGFVFVNHHERGRPLPDRRGVRFTLRLAGGGTLVFPPAPVTVPSGACFLWPFRLPLRPGLTLDWATAQPVTRREGPVPGFWFATTGDIPAQFGFSTDIATPAGPVRQLTLAPGRHTIAVAGRKIRCRITVLTAAESLRLFDRKPTRSRRAVPVRFTRLRPAGPARRVPRAPTPHGVAAAPTDADFAAAAWWTLALPEALDLRQRWLLRVHYTGDVARIHLGEKLLLDDFYHGRPVELALWRHTRLLRRQPLRLAVLPLRKDAPIGFSPPEIRPRFGRRRTVVALHRVELVPA